VKAALGLSATLDLANVDILTAAATDPEALAAQRAAVMIATILVGAGEAAGGVDAAAAVTAALQNLAGQVGEPGSQVDLTNTDTITQIVTAGLPEGTDVGAVVALLGDATQSISTAQNVGAIAEVQHEAVIALDQTAPDRPTFGLDVTSDTGASQNDRLTADATPTLRGMAEAGSIISIYNENELIGSTVTAANGSWQVTLGTLADGAQDLIATATDASANVSEDVALSFTIDTFVGRPGTPDLADPSDGGPSPSDDVTDDVTPTIVGGGAEAGATVTLYDTDGVTVVGSAIADSGGTWSITSMELNEGTHSLTVKQVDLAGNISAASIALTVKIDLSTDTRNDFNGDGRSDILWQHENGTVTNWLGQANGGMSGNFANLNVGSPTGWQIAGTGDFNGDGRDDILWQHENGTVTNWLGQANGGMTGNFANLNVGSPIGWHIQSADLWI